MTLATRLSWFFVAALAAVLAGFSVALHAMAAHHLHRRADERLEDGLNTLAAAAEIGPEGVEWEPEERSLSLGRRRGLDTRFAWRVGDDRGRRLDGSAPDRVDAALATAAGATPRFGAVTDRSSTSWRTLTRRLDRPGSTRALEPGRYEALVLGTAVALDEVAATLRRLDVTLLGLSLGVEALALLGARRLCLAALRPLRVMADEAGAIGGDEPGRRLPAPLTADELGELGRSFNALLDRLGESLGRQQRFTGDASHQLRTPLTAIQGQVDLALRHERSPEEYRRVLALVQGRTRHLRQIVESLLFLARADAEARRPELRPVALGEWLTAHLEGWDHPRRADLRVERPGSGDPTVRIHAPLLGEAVDNLLDNAAKYGPPGTAITVRVEPAGDEARISIHNHGPAIDPADLARVFDPFFRSETARLGGTPGLGLGLSVAARVAAVLGGRIAATSDPAGGTTFTVSLPAAKAAEPGRAQ